MSEWWRDAVIYQIYPKSFKDSNGDGYGDLDGISEKLPEISSLGVDGIWLSPFYPSPQKDSGYDVSDYYDVDPIFGTVDDFSEMVQKAHELNLKVLLDLVPNHTSSAHPWFQNALNSKPGSDAREMYLFAEGCGKNGELPPNNWQSMFGGPAWTRVSEPDGSPGQWYCHLFDSSQPDLNWRNPEVVSEFQKIMRFWFDLGADGFRVDQPHALIKAIDFPDHPYVEQAGSGFIEGEVDPPMWFQPEVHEILRQLRQTADEAGEKVLCGEGYVLPLSKMAMWVRPDELHQNFNFRFLDAHWVESIIKEAIDESLDAFPKVGSQSTWTLNNHDVVRSVSRFGTDYSRPTQSDGIGPNDVQPNNKLGGEIAVGAALLMLALPGNCYLYQGEEIGLPDHTAIPDSDRQDPTFFRTEGLRVGRDGARAPIPWDSESPNFGFSKAMKTWLPQPANYGDYARAGNKTLAVYQAALLLRKKHKLGQGELRWLGDDIFGFENSGVRIYHNFDNADKPMPAGEILISSLGSTDSLKPNETVWLVG